MFEDSPAAGDVTPDPLDADELMDIAGRIETLPAESAVWVQRLFDECLRARLHEAELLAGQPAASDEVAAPAGAVLDEQLAQVALDAAEWLRTLWNVGYMGAGSFPSAPCSAFPLVALEDVMKSALFARIRQGKRPLPFPPPTRHGLPWHAVVEAGSDETYDVDAEIVRDEQGALIGAIIEGCADWQVVEESAADGDYVVQHRGKGPCYRLSLSSDPWLPGGMLRREPPRWTRVIRRSERGGYLSYLLEWRDAAGVETAGGVPLRAATWERAESEAAFWIANNAPGMYGQVRFERVE